MEQCIIIRYGELFLKGKNKVYFERTLFSNIKTAIAKISCNLYKISGRLVINKFDCQDQQLLLQQLKTVFGIHSFSPAKSFPTSMETIVDFIAQIEVDKPTFKVDVNRADKTFELNSIELAKKLGGVVLKNNPALKVNLTKPDTTIFVDIRENGETFLFHEVMLGLGGMPVGTAGQAMLLLSGGIDSPVAGFQMAKRGLSLHAVHFHSFPYTSLQAKQKVIDLAKIMSNYTGPIVLHIIPFTAIQEAIHRNCRNDYLITIMRRFMMKISQHLAQKNNCGALITGESLGQVASQTMQSITATNAVVSLPVFRPLIGLDKDEIVEIARKINTFETSILPYEDCCTVFLPAHPVIKPNIKIIENEEARLPVEDLILNALNGEETMLVDNN